MEQANSSASTSRKSGHAGVRATLAKMFSVEDPRLAKCLALAAHPWPDNSSPEIIDAITSELVPLRNLNHPNPCEVAIDRLLRISETLGHLGADDLANRFTIAAEVIQENADTCVSTMTETSIANPLGVVSKAESPTADAGVFSLPAATRKNLLDHLTGCTLANGSDDVGAIQNGSPIGLSVPSLASILGVESLVVAFERFVDSLDPRDQDICHKRLFTLKDPLTLMELAEGWGCTRQRIRQRETRIRERFDAKLRERFRRLSVPLLSERGLRHVVRAKEVHETVLGIAPRSRWPKAVAAAALLTIGDYQIRNSWFVHDTIKLQVDEIEGRINTLADEHGVVSVEDVRSALNELFRNDNESEEFAHEALRMRKVCGYWALKGLLPSRIAAALKHLGRPATKEEIAEIVEYDPARISSHFPRVQGVVRADRYRWGFDEWVDDPYDGIVGEINQRIDEYGGSVRVGILLDEIPSKFDVTALSVRAYLGTDAFVVENHMVRRADTSKFDAKDPEKHSGAHHHQGFWGQRIKLDERFFNGYSMGINFDIAYANGIRPHDHLVVPINDSKYCGTLIWRPHSPNRLIDVGRAADFLKASEFSPGSEVLVVPTRDQIKLLRLEELDVEGHAEPDTERTDSGVVDPLLDMLGE